MRALLPAVLLLAGCLAAPTHEGAAAADPALTMAWGVEECAFVIVAIPVDYAALAARLPAGFRLAPGTLGLLPSGPNATIEFDAYRCERVRWGSETTEDASYGSYYTGVLPPSALRQAGYNAYFVKWDVLVADDAARETLAAAGVPAHAGAAQVRIDGPTITASLGFDDGAGFSLTGAMRTPPASASAAPLPFTEYTPLEGGNLARWHARLHDAPFGQGAGVVELSPGWVRDLVGADRAPATFIAGTWNLDQADVAAPIVWP